MQAHVGKRKLQWLRYTCPVCGGIDTRAACRCLGQRLGTQRIAELKGSNSVH